MRDLIQPTQEELNEIKEFFKIKYNLTLNDSEAREVYLSLYFLGKAIYRFNKLDGGSNDK